MGTRKAAEIGFLSKEQVDESLAEVVRMMRDKVMTPRQYYGAIVRLSWAYARANHLHEAMSCLAVVPGDYLTKHMPDDAVLVPGLGDAAVGMAAYLMRNNFVGADAAEVPTVPFRWPGRA